MKRFIRIYQKQTNYIKNNITQIKMPFAKVTEHEYNTLTQIVACFSPLLFTMFTHETSGFQWDQS